MNWPWSELGLSGPADLAAVRRAYAEKLKTTHPEDDPEGFQRLHEAYQQARRLARTGRAAQPSQRETAPPEEAGETFGQQPEEPAAAEDDGELDRVFQAEARRRAEERERQSQKAAEAFFSKYPAGTEEERRKLEQRFARIEAALTIVEELYDGHALLQDWISFLHSGIFFSVKGDADFVSGLEAFLRRTPDLDETVKHELAQVFGLRKQEVPPEWRGLQELLTGVAYRPPAPAEKKPLRKRWSLWIAGIVLLLLAGIPLAAHQLREMRERPGREARALMCQYLEEDMGRRMESLWNGQPAYENLYAPWDQPGLTFMAWPDGERDPAAGKPGYTTNYGNVMLTEALEDFSKQQGWELEKDQEGGCTGVMGAYGTSPGGYFLKVPLRGGEEGVAALCALMDSLQAERWYQAASPSYSLGLTHQNIVWYDYRSDRTFDGDSLLELYQTKLGVRLCAYLVEQSGLAEADFGGTGYWLEEREPVELDGASYFLVSGMDADTGETVRQYLYDGARLVSLPAERFSLDMKAYEIMGDWFQSGWQDQPLTLQILRK